MSFLDKISQTASDTYKYTAEKTNKIAKMAKLKSNLNQNKQKIDDLYNEIGKAIYQNYVREEREDIGKKIEDLCTEIEAYADEIELIRKELLKLKDLKQCQVCSYEMELDYKFCPSCGARQEDNSSAASKVADNKENETIKDDTEEQESSTKDE